MNFNRDEWKLILVVSLGYLVDLYDVLLFSIVRVPSIQSFDIYTPSEVTQIGIDLHNLQMLGLLLGGIFFGVWADKSGRLKVLFASIFLYSMANILNAFVPNTFAYGLCRFVAGFGLAGELGVGITFISEKIAKNKRTIATMIVASTGLMGGVLAAFVGQIFTWKIAYILGGVMGLMLLGFRFGTQESEIFKSQENHKNSKGNFIKLLADKDKRNRYLKCIFSGAPAFIFTSLYITLSPEFAKAQGITDNLDVSIALITFMLAFSISDIFGGFLSKTLKSRKKTLLYFVYFQVFALLFYLYFPSTSVMLFYLKCLFLGLGTGYWGVLITNSAEQFGTDLRATVTTSVPNFIRGLTIPATILFKNIYKGQVIFAGALVGFLFIGISFWAISQLHDQFENDLDFVEV